MIGGTLGRVLSEGSCSVSGQAFRAQTGKPCSRLSISKKWQAPFYERKQAPERLIARMGIKWMESFNAVPELQAEARKELAELLRNPTFCKQVASETGQQSGVELEFSELLFTPVPWSPTTSKGMPQELEKYHEDPNYVTVNVPPNFMFQAKIFKPSRLCAFYKVKSS